MQEIWKDIPGYEGRYQASTEGRIRSCDWAKHCVPKDGKKPYDRTHKGRLLRTCRGSNGYQYVGLRKTAKCKNAKYMPVFHLIAMTFLGPRPGKAVICHANGRKEDCRLENLRYDTAAENNLDVYRTGGKCGKLSIEQALEVKRRLKEGQSISSIARAYGVSRTAVYYIREGAHFGWLR